MPTEQFEKRPEVPVALAALFAKRPAVIRLGLERMERAVDALGRSALMASPSVLVGGTNGKGSTAGFLWQLCAASGARVALYSSPHLVAYEERVQTSHAEVDAAMVIDALETLRRRLPKDLYDELSFFEVGTLVALSIFRCVGTELDILEVGLGGRLDATNVCSPVLAVITSIGLDHTEFLGRTSAAIAREKAAIMRPGQRAIWGGEKAGDGDAHRAIVDASVRIGASLSCLDADILLTEEGIVVTLSGRPNWQTSWPPQAVGWPDFLRRNFALAVGAFWELAHGDALAKARARPGQREQGVESFVEAALQAFGQGRIATPPTLFGRFQTVTGKFADPARRLILDVGHNPHGAQALVDGLRQTGCLDAGPVPGLVSILGDKDVGGILDILRPALSPLHLFASKSERAFGVKDTPLRHQDLPFHPSFADAWRAVEGQDTDRPLVICGSVYAVGEVCSALGVDPLGGMKALRAPTR